MSDRHNIVTCSFEKESPRISAFDIHEWIYDKLQMTVDELKTIKIDGSKRRVYIKCTDSKQLDTLVKRTNGNVHTDGTISQIHIGHAGMGSRTVRDANLPPDLNNGTMKRALRQYVTILSINDEIWSSVYRYTIKNGVRVLTMELKTHFPSQNTYLDTEPFFY
jgi:hypothetical protein